MSEPKKKPMRDQETLAQVLEAAYVMQERNRELQKADPTRNLTKNQRAAAASPGSYDSGLPPQQTLSSYKADSVLTLAQIVEIQHQIQVCHLEFENVMTLVVDRMTHIAGVSGAAVGIVDGEQVHYRATAGVMAPPVGNKVPLEKALGSECLRSGQIFRCADVASDLLLDQDECRRRGIQGIIAAPVFHDGGVAGILELYFPTRQAFTEDDIHTCQLMAGLLSEALARNEKVAWKKSLSTERAVMLEALEKLKPNLATLADTAADKNLLARAGALPNGTLSTTGIATVSCRQCGHELIGQEQFCGNCGSPRTSDHAFPNLGSTKATSWQMQAPLINSPPPPSTNGASRLEESNTALDHLQNGNSIPDSIDEHVIEPYAAAELGRDQEVTAELFDAPAGIDFETSAHSDLEVVSQAIEPVNVEAPEFSSPSENRETPAAWSSAATTRNFLEQLATAKASGTWAHFWNRRRGDIYLAAAVILVLGVLRWGIWSSHAASQTGRAKIAAGQHRTAPDAELPLFDRILVGLGLAEAPEPPAYRGNPRTQVWVDLQTALYYCPGTDVYGKTPKGRFSSQREAQLDQFEPAYRKACD